MYDFRLNDVAEWVNRNGYSTVALQLPEGLKTFALEMIERLTGLTGASYIIIGDPCYGACDVSQVFGSFSDALVHFGHSEIPSLGEMDDVLFIEVRVDTELDHLLEEVLPSLSQRVGILATVQYIGLLPEVRLFLEKNGHEVFISNGDDRLKYGGQVLGCNYSSAADVSDEVDEFLFIGEGNFHPLAVAIGTGRKVTILDPLMNEVRNIDELRDRILRQRHGAIVKASDAQSFIVILSSKIGQKRADLASRLKAMIEAKGRKADIVVMEEISPDRLLPFDAEAYVSTACPRLAMDDYIRYDRPIITPVELEIALGERDWEDYEFDSISG
jgi:2-(3-amino-3-carboxypropyl)histidine synthase